ncbi:hypothetical protein NP493_740g02047 [Ridgeia piscesae]|uniref:Ig-like domain-containing protein n=1 Tax=Ridgeia piscesae TaxID=27915 RepID=A0AAD9KPU6_RIDPI|nr:hypothetical protein NP493_740g02047 [Ridgeia piscesae]
MATFRSAGQLSALSLFSLVALCVFGSIRQGSGSLNQASGLGFYRWRWGERPQWGPIGNGPGGRLQSTGRYYVKWYECDVTIPGSSTVLDLNAADSISRESTREVPSRAAPAAGGVLAFTIRPTNTTVETGEPVTFECAVNQPGADITWYFNDDELYTDRSRGIDVDGSVVLIAEVTSRDAGEYECVASSDEGRPLQTHVFRCSPAKRSVDRVTWWRDGSQITTSGRFRVLVNGFLRIRRLTLGDSGVYTCVVRPKIGGHCSDAVIVQLTVNLSGSSRLLTASRDRSHVFARTSRRKSSST